MALSTRALALLGGALVVTAGLGGLLVGSREPTRPDPTFDAPDLGAPAPVPARPEPELAPPTVRDDATSPTFAAWDVRAVDPSGRPLADARLVATGPGGARREATGRALWDDVVPGEWTLAVEHADYPRHEVAAAPSLARTLRTIVRLDHAVRLSGTVRDRHGAPKPGTRVWFLRKNEAHPIDGDTARARVAAIADREGAFRVELPEAGPWRASIGGVGRAEVASDVQEIGYGWPTGLDVVLAGATRLEVRFDAPVEHADRAVLQILERVTDHPTSTPPPERMAEDLMDGIRDERLERAGLTRGDGRGSLEDSVLPIEPGTPDPAPDRPEWMTRSATSLARRSHVVQQGLPAGQELRLALVVDEQRYESAQSFLLRGDEVLVVELKAPRVPESTSAIDLPLPLQVRIEPLPDRAPAAGFHWR